MLWRWEASSADLVAVRAPTRVGADLPQRTIPQLMEPMIFIHPAWCTKTGRWMKMVDGFPVTTGSNN